MINQDIICSNKFTGGQLIALSGTSGHTDFDNGLVLRTGFDSKSINIVYPQKLEIKFDFEIKDSFIGSDWVILQSEKKSHKLVFINASTVALQGDWTIESINQYKLAEKNGIQIISQREIDDSIFNFEIDKLISFNQKFLQSKKENITRWKQNQDCVNKALIQINTMICSPEGRINSYWSTPDRWPHRKMWLWDSVFHAAGIRHIDINIAKSILSSVFDCQNESTGFIPHMMTPHENSNITQPPVLALGIKLILEKEGYSRKSISWMNTFYHRLEKYLNWVFDNRDTDGDGLVEWFIEENEECRSGESGMDNSVRFDEAITLAAVDFNAFLSNEYGIMGKFASLLGKDDEAKIWLEKKNKLDKLINSCLWDSKKKFYFDFNFKNNKISPVKSVAGFLPIFSETACSEQIDYLVEELNNPETFGVEFPIPSISIDNDNYDTDMWRGPTWVNMNWIIGKSLLSTKHREKGLDIIKKTIEIIENNFDSFGTFFEYYDCKNKIDPPSLKRKKRCDPERSPYHQVFFDYGWTACLYVDMINIIQEIER